MRERKRELVGRVVSDKMDKTVVVAVQSLRRHRLYQRTVRRTKKFMAHNESNQARQGDLVRIQESRPISRHIGWSLYAAVALFGLMTVVLGVTQNYAVAFVALVVLSGADAVSVFVRTTIVPLAT